MGKRMKKGITGDPATFITRSQALRKLQLNLSEFRRLCILKGIFPKEPKKKFKGVNKTYYYLQDIKFLAHEKLLRKFREIKSYEKKIKKARVKHEKFNVDRLIELKPTYTIDHILKERYPLFKDALNDLDDALCLINIFANLPKHELLKINSETVGMCQRLIREFYLYSSIIQNFRKGFISIKGIYLQVELLGSKVTWLSPFNYPQKLSFEIDYNIMLNFLELYTNLLKFVNLKLFKDVGLDYPPPVENSDTPFFGLNSLDIRTLQEKVASKSSVKDEVNMESEEWKRIMQAEEENRLVKSLFSNCVFFIGREVPSEIFAMAVMSSGGLYGDESDTSPFQYNDERITHYIVDRPKEFITFQENKEYVQPQWVFDCINNKRLLPVSDYFPGKKLPPHLSPFYEVNEDGTYIYHAPSTETQGEEKKEEEVNQSKPSKEDLEIREMMISKNKKKLLNKIREEKMKKRKKHLEK